MTDEELVAILQSQSESIVYSVLYDRYERKIFYKSLAMVKDEDQAADLTQDIFVKAFSALDKFRAESKFSTWLHSIAYHYCIDYIRKNKRTIQNQRLDDIQESNILVEAESAEGTEFIVLNPEVLLEAMDHMKPEEKMILIMKYQDDLSVKQIQTVMKFQSESAVKMRLKRAKQKAVIYYNQLMTQKSSMIEGDFDLIPKQA
jgi:RNA polymerase sigma-70 factor (ECF subfamily)